MISYCAVAQTGELAGIVYDAEIKGSGLPFADVYIKGTTKGTNTDMEGKFTLTNIDPGTYTVGISFVGYETKEITGVEIVAGQVTKISETLGLSAASLDNVVVTATTSVKESRAALLTQQKKSVEIKESIGVQDIKKLAISDAAAATAKISGVTKNESTGDVYVRGLGDRYLSTTMNGLPIPSDNVENKNISLRLFPTSVIQNVGISKTYSPDKYADQASGNVNIVLKEFSGSKPKFSISVNSGANTNALTGGEFKRTQNKNNLKGGYYKTDLNTREALTRESWNPTTESNPINVGVSATAGAKIWNKLSVFASASHSISHSDRIGEFRFFDENFVNDSISDAETFRTRVVTSGLLNTVLKVNRNHKLKFSALYINNTLDEVNEFGRNGRGVFFEETDRGEATQFVRDQNTKQTTVGVFQLTGNNKFEDLFDVKWGVGYNVVDALEPNRIRNEVNIFGDNDIRFGTQDATQQRKSIQKIQDREYNGYFDVKKSFIDEDEKSLDIAIGYNHRNKQRQFDSRIEALDLETGFSDFSVRSFDNLDEGLGLDSVRRGIFTILENGQTDLYDGELLVNAGYVNVFFNLNKLSGSIGARYEVDELNLPQWDVTNGDPTADNFLFNKYDNFLPSYNLKYELNDKMFLRHAASKTITLPEFKEIAPFEYTQPNGRQTVGNTALIASTNYNADFKFEYFPSSKELLSATVFGKIIQDPINKAQQRGGAGNLSYFNTADEAKVLGLELEGKKDIIDNDNLSLNLLANVTAMWHEQDLKAANPEIGENDEFRYGDKDKIGLQGASDWIVNGALSYSNKEEKEFTATTSFNYSSDKIFALGNAEDVDNFRTRFNNEIIEEGFATLDLILTQELIKGLKLTATAQNLLDPKIKRTQEIISPLTGIKTKETVLSYRKGLFLNIKLTYKF